MRGNFSALLAATPCALAAASLLARRRWSFVAGACLIIALALWLTRGADGAFVAATLGIVAWFWDQRNRLRAIVIEPAPDDEQDGGDDEDVEDHGDDGDRLDEAGEANQINGVEGMGEGNASDDYNDSDRRAGQ